MEKAVDQVAAFDGGILCPDPGLSMVMAHPDDHYVIALMDANFA